MAGSVTKLAGDLNPISRHIEATAGQGLPQRVISLLFFGGFFFFFEDFCYSGRSKLVVVVIWCCCFGSICVFLFLFYFVF